MPSSLLAALYLGVSRISGPLARLLVNRRLARGKEDPDRVSERFGRTRLARPAGRLIWFHAASVGEALSLLKLIDTVLKSHPDAHVVLTTVTRTSAALLAERLPERAHHQFAPVDTWGAVGAFLDHWSPDLAIWTESELWPTMIHRTRKRGVPMLLINGRMSERSHQRLRRLGRFPAAMLNAFDAVMVQDESYLALFLDLGIEAERLSIMGNLKDQAEALPVDADALSHMQTALGDAPLWLAASTHPGEEEIVAEAHALARKQRPDLRLILVPRHPERGAEIAATLRAQGWDVAQRSSGDDPQADIYLADTIGELGLWYRLAPVSFVGGSLVPIGGHNPMEPMMLGSAVLTGPHVFNFEAAYTRLRDANAAREVADAETLAEAVLAQDDTKSTPVAPQSEALAKVEAAISEALS